MKLTRNTLLGFVTFATTLALVWWFLVGRFQVSQIRFDPAAWKQADPKSTTPGDGYRTVRSRMIEDLLRRYNFEGWSRQQVIDLLGQPTGKWSGFEQWDLIYVLGLERAVGYALDDEALGFKFDAADRVMKYGLSIN